MCGDFRLQHERRYSGVSRRPSGRRWRRTDAFGSSDRNAERSPDTDIDGKPDVKAELQRQSELEPEHKPESRYDCDALGLAHHRRAADVLTLDRRDVPLERLRGEPHEQHAQKRQ